jgi:hypothetical protein
MQDFYSIRNDLPYSLCSPICPNSRRAISTFKFKKFAYCKSAKTNVEISPKGGNHELTEKPKEEQFDREGFERLQRDAQEYESRLRERLGKFSIDEVLRQAKDLRSVFVEGLGEVRYVLLSEADISEIAKKYPDDPRERNLQALYRSLASADPEVTVEKLRALPYDVSRVLQETVLNASFLPPKKTSKPGSQAAANFKASS